MPQIWPMNWIILFTLFILAFIFFLSFNYFLNPSVKITQIEMENKISQFKSLEWKW
uniref:ATP synthase complex subunit 8 n=1 Tax=Daphnia laevis TaxID=42853 RepID=A0A5Q0RZ55_9CRUS|nr:ATP synthase F0 subunit 8 [Daphnia laevis]QGA47445.1 ATP synthase F0 subunit 8 [Daphnia laevis]